jgi:hypothetical protein
MTDDDAKISNLPVRPKRALGNGHELSMAAPAGECWHRGGYLVDERLAEVVCAVCKAKLNPIWVLQQLTMAENRFHDLHARYQDELMRLNARSRTKCEHCGGMTRISHR